MKTAKRADEGGKWLLFKFHFLITSMLSPNLEAGSPLSLPAHQLFFLLPTKANPAGTREASGLASSIVVFLFPEKDSVCDHSVPLDYSMYLQLHFMYRSEPNYGFGTL